MSPPERRPPVPAGPHSAGGAAPHPQASRYVWFAGLVALLVFVLIAARNIAGSSGAAGIPPGQRIPPFAVPLALGPLTGDANVATRANEGAAGRVPACAVQLPQAFNVCDAYAHGPLVLALFVNAGSCPEVLGELQGLARSFPGVRVAAVEIRGDRGALRSLVRRDRIGFPVGYDHDGVLADLYRVSSCPQVSFVDRGGVVAEPALLGSAVTAAALRARIARLVARAQAPTGPSPA